jgi:hypothetical protein
MVDQFADLFRTTHKVKTQQVVKSRGHHCGDIELAGYLANETVPVSLVLDLRIAHDTLQEFCQRNQILDSSTITVRLSLPNSKAKLVWLLLRLQFYVLRLI